MILHVIAIAMPFSIALTQLAVALAFFLWLIRLGITKGRGVPSLKLEWAFLAFMAAAIIATVFSADVQQSFVHLKRLLLIPLVYLVAADAADERMLKRLGLLFFLSLVLYSLWGIGWYLIHPGRRIQHLHHFMTAGGITMIGGVLGMAFASRAPARKNRLVLAIASSPVIICLILTNTRGSWLAFFCAAALLLFFTRKTLLLMLPILMLVFYLLTPQAFVPRLQHFFDPDWRTNAKRVYWWKAGWQIFLDHPLVGVGDIATTNVYNQYAAAEKRGRLNHFHSNYVHIAVTMGAVGLAAFVYLTGAIFIQLYRAWQNCPSRGGWPAAWTLAALAIFFAFNINGFFEWNFGDAEIVTMIWFCTGMGLAAARLPVTT